jgi:hypothetical protein
MSSTSYLQSGSAIDIGGTSRRSNFAFLGWITVNCLGLNALLHFIALWSMHRAWLPYWLFDSNFHALNRYLHLLQGNDSWRPMLSAMHFWQAHPQSSIYQNVFFSQHIKFQYPLTSLLPLVALNKLGLSDLQIWALGRTAGWISAGLVALMCVAIARHSASSTQGQAPRLDIAAIVAILLGSLLFYPLLTGCVLGQIQTILTLFYSVAFYCWLRGYERTSGVFIGLMILVKPQFSFLLLWAALRKRWNALIAGLACVALILPIALIMFGWRNNWDYLSVLRALSSVGESFYANHSMNGLLNRFLFNGDQIFHPDSFPPFHSVVYAGTLLSSFFLFGLALIFPGGRERLGGMADFACAAAVATMASPIVWEHHYGIFLPILVWLWFGRTSGRAPVRNTAWLAVAYILISDCLSPLNLLWRIPVLNIAQSYMYIGGLMIVWLLLSPRYAATSAVGTRLEAPHTDTVHERDSGRLKEPDARLSIS